MKTPDKMWLGIAGSVAAYDVLCRPGETLSERMDDYMEKPLGKALTVLAVGTVALHLTNILPRQIDPLYQATKKWKQA